MTSIQLGIEVGQVRASTPSCPVLSQRVTLLHILPGGPSGWLLRPRHASDDIPVKELHSLCDQWEHLYIVPDWPDVWTYHQTSDTRAQGQVEPP